MRLTPAMRDALERALREDGLRRVHTLGKGKPPWPAHHATLAALQRHGLVDHARDRDRRAFVRDTWTITDAGRVALDPPPKPRPERPVYLAPAGSGRDHVGIPAGDQKDNSGDWTLNPSKSVDYEICDVSYIDADGNTRTFKRRVAIPALIDPDLLDHQPARVRHAGAQSGRQLARRLARNIYPDRGPREKRAA